MSRWFFVVFGFFFLFFGSLPGVFAGMEPAVSSAAYSRINSEIEQVRRQGYQAFLEGRSADAENAYRYLEVMGSEVDRPDENLAIIDRDRGENDQALAHWLRTSLDSSADGFVFNQRGWAYLAAGGLREAKDSFTQAVKRSFSSAQQAEAYLGLGLEEEMDSRPKAELSALSLSLTKSPYLLAAVYDKTGQAELRLGNPEAALAAFNRSLSLDVFNFEAMVDLAKLDFKIGENKDAWILYHRLKELDPERASFAKWLKRIEKYLTENPRQILPERRISRPFLVADAFKVPSLSSPTIRVALFTGEDAKPHTMTRVYFMCNQTFKIVAASGETIRDAIEPFNQWQISFRSENNLVEVRDTAGNIEYASKEPFKIIPSSGADGSVLLKSARFPNTVGFDSGDRELRGTIEVIPNPEGFRLVNETGVETYLYGVVGRALGGQSPMEAYEAEAVIARTTALWYKSQGRPNLEKSDICDSAACQSYLGVTSEMSRSTKGTRKTSGLVLSFNGRVARVAWHSNCGGFTEDGADYPDPSLKELVSVADAPTDIPRPSSPADFERWIHEFPPDSLYSNAAGLPQTYSRWVRIISADWIRRRIRRFKDIGKIMGIRVLKRSETGRILALKFVGAKGDWTADGFHSIRLALSPNSLRSSLFTITPIQDGRFARFFILWGAGTGSGLGLCMDGALGQASLGKDFREILKRYFPNYQIERAYGGEATKPHPVKKTLSAAHHKKSARSINFRRALKKKVRKKAKVKKPAS